MTIITSARTPEDIVNAALVDIGYPLQIANLQEGTRAARMALAIYGQTRDMMLRDNDFDFAQRTTSLTLLKQAPPGGYMPPNKWTNAYPPPQWLYEYAYPTDCLRVRAVKPEPLFALNFTPKPFVYTIDNDAAFNPPQKVILCNVTDAVLVYVGRVTDVTIFEIDFVTALVKEIGARLSKGLADLNTERMEGIEAQQADAKAAQTQG